MKYSSKKGFTLIETLVAIAILMVAIAGPLDIAEKGLIAAVNSRNQTIAYSALVIGISLVVAALLGAFDYIFSHLLTLLF